MKTMIRLSFFVVALQIGFVSLSYSAAPSRQELFSKLYSAGFSYVLETFYSQRSMSVKILNEDGSYRNEQVHLGNRDVPIQYIEALGYVNKHGHLAHAYKVGEAMVCYLHEYRSIMSGKIMTGYLSDPSRMEDCLLFPHDIDSVIEAIQSV